MKIKNCIFLFLIVFLSLSFTSYPFAQAGRGVARISGEVKDEEGKTGLILVEVGCKI